MHGSVHMCCMAWCMVLPGLVMLGLGVGGSLDGGSEEVVGVVSCKIFFGYLGMDHNLADLC